MAVADKNLEALMKDLPDEKGAHLLFDRLNQEHPRVAAKLIKEPGLLSDVLALAAWSPLLATTLEQNPTYISWLSRERATTRVRTKDELRESLARFALTHTSVAPQVLLARFRRRELLRIYLQDLRRTHTIVETTEELSNLADAILEHALNLARQELDNRFGPPQFVDNRGRVATAEFCVVALGKLGSLELNYSSDIDLFFLYSDEGETSGSGDRGSVTNREYFVKLAEVITRIVGSPAGEGAAYRVDLRLRPFGRDGALASSLEEATRYYFQKAQPWELQTLIRARSSAGWPALFVDFSEAVRRKVFRVEVSVPEALESVRIAKQKIDHQELRRGGTFNVKLGRGGIREIEFIAQALQLAHGGKDPWLRAQHTLITLGRLADRGLLSEEERAELSDAYDFLRRIEHRLQMEHGLQVHAIPADPAQYLLLARRMNFAGPDAVLEFEAELKLHTNNVRRVYDRVFAEKSAPDESNRNDVSRWVTSSSAREAPTVSTAAAAFTTHIDLSATPGIVSLLNESIATSLNPSRAAMFTSRIGASLEKASGPISLSETNLKSMVRLCGASEFFGEMVAANPMLIAALDEESGATRDYRAVLRKSIDAEKTFSGELSALRRTWSQLLLEIGNRDINGAITRAESNRLQTELAKASINVAYLIARREMARKYGNLAAGPRLAILGLGRLASGGVDYGSDLDLILIYDSQVASPLASSTPDEAYARLGELMVAALSSITRTGHLYHVDLRLRPHGSDGPLVSGSQTFLEYLQGGAAVWEWLAYVKLRAVAGDLELGRDLENAARKIIHEGASRISSHELGKETSRVRARLEQEQPRSRRRGLLDIKYGSGGMLDVYFATRYLQLRHGVPDEGDDRSTLLTLDRLREKDFLSSSDYEALRGGYSLLRAVDHEQRLLLGRSARLPSPEHPAMRDIAKRLGHESAETLLEQLKSAMEAIRASYLSVLDSGEAAALS